MYFNDVPEVSVLLCLFTFFETKQNWDGLDSLVFNRNRLLEKTFNHEAGCLRADQGKRMGEILVFAAEEEGKRRKREQASNTF
ncbi:hypothetical protein GCM10028895_52660 [Pontibacter rugosus]